MFKHHKVEIEWGGRPLILETGKVARQADGAVLGHLWRDRGHGHRRFGQGAEARPRLLPADRQLPGKDLRGRQDPRRLLQARRPSEREGDADLAPHRPADPPALRAGYKNDTQIIVTVLQHDLENDPDVLAMVATSAALTLSGVPFMGPIGGARVGYIAGEYVLNPHIDEMPESKLDLVVAGTTDAVMMVESEAQRAFRGDHARRGHVRPQGLPAGDRRDHQAGRSRRQGAARFRAGRPLRARGRDAEAGRGRAARGLQEHRQAGALRRRRRGQGQGQGSLRGTRGRAAQVDARAGFRDVQGTAGQGGSLEHPRHGQPHRRP
jgi:hypothetical protein